MRLAVYSIIGLIVLLECFGRLQILGADKAVVVPLEVFRHLQLDRMLQHQLSSPMHDIG